MIVPGPIWRRHRHFLVAERPLECRGAFHILDATTGRRYAWENWPPGGVTIGVPTTWAYTHPGWTTRVFYLVPAPERDRRTDGRAARIDAGVLGRALAWLRCRLI